MAISQSGVSVTTAPDTLLLRVVNAHLSTTEDLLTVCVILYYYFLLAAYLSTTMPCNIEVFGWFVNLLIYETFIYFRQGIPDNNWKIRIIQN